MRLSAVLVSTAVLAVAATLPAGASTPVALSPVVQHHHGSRTIVGLASRDERFSTLVAAVQAAGLVDTLTGDGPFTVFAPVNDAFAALPTGTVDGLLQPRARGTLTSILTYHVVPGRITARDLLGAVRAGNGRARLTTVEGGTLTVTADGHGALTLTDEKGARIRVVVADVRASNGVIHAIDGVLMPG
ncbi:MAG: fasciclin domain-containing protein [Caulobacteraceae bacterium]|nr:fasciclin domain-containing protein [Caulobacteraceae bacterium]